MADVLRPDKSNGLATYPGPHTVKLDAAVNAEQGIMLVTVSGYGKIPAAANAATGKMRGVVVDSADNTSGAQGALSCTVRPGRYRFANSAGNPCSQATVGSKVYAADGNTISSNSADGPLAGVLLEYDASDAQGRPCDVALMCFPL